MVHILGKIFSVMSLVSLLFAIITGNIEALAAAILDGSAKAVTLTLALVGAMGFWGGIMRVLEDAGVCRFLAALLRPIMKLIFPATVGRGIAEEEIAGCISANMLGLGNAATPMGIRAMQAMSAGSADGEASDDMITFVVMNTCPVSLLPTTLIALRRAATSSDPFRVLVPIWIVSAVCSVVAVFFAKGFSLFTKRKSKGA